MLIECRIIYAPRQVNNNDVMSIYFINATSIAPSQSQDRIVLLVVVAASELKELLRITL